MDKPKLRARIMPVFRVHFQDLEHYIQKVYGFEFDLLYATGCTPDMCPEYQITGSLPSSISKQVRDLKLGKRTRNLSLILNVLAKDEYIPAGKYIIDTHKKPKLIDVYHNLLLRVRDPSLAECLKFKEDHKDNRQLMDQINIMDQAALDQLNRAKR